MRTLFPAIWYLRKGPHHVSLNRFGRLESMFYRALGPPLGSSIISETAGRETEVTSRMDENIDTDQKVLRSEAHVSDQCTASCCFGTAKESSEWLAWLGVMEGPSSLDRFGEGDADEVGCWSAEQSTQSFSPAAAWHHA